MGRRFGRNQKRAMRQHIRLAELVIASRDKTVSRLETDLKQANITIERTAQVLGDHFVTLPVKTAEVDEILDRFKVSIFQHNRLDSLQRAVYQAVDYVDTHQASVRIDELQGTNHMRYRSISGDVAYALSSHTWRKLSEGHLIELLSKEIAPEMARHLVRERKKLFQ